LKESSLREAHLETLNLIALSVHPNRLRDYRFESRYECLSYIKVFLFKIFGEFAAFFWGFFADFSLVCLLFSTFSVAKNC